MPVVLSTRAYVLMSSTDEYHGGEVVIAVYESFDDAKKHKKQYEDEQKPCPMCGNKVSFFIHHSRYIKEIIHE